MKKLLESRKWRTLAFFLCLVFGLLTVACGACGLYDYFEFGMDPGAEPNFTQSDFYYAYVHERAISTRLEDGYVNLYMFLFNGRMVFLPLAGAGLLLTLALFAFLLASVGRTPEGVELLAKMVAKRLGVRLRKPSESCAARREALHRYLIGTKATQCADLPDFERENGNN